MALEIKNINSEDDMLNYLLGCLNDFENGITTKADTMQNLVDYTMQIVEMARETKPKQSSDEVLHKPLVSNPLSCHGCRYNNTTNDELCGTCGDTYKNKAT